MGRLVIEKLLNGSLYEYTYFVHEENSKVGFAVDPGYDVKKVMGWIAENGFIVKDVLLTHGHFDHVLACPELEKKFAPTIYLSKEDEEILYDPVKSFSILINKTTFDRFDITKYVKDGDTIEVLERKVKCIATPGHTKGGVCYYFKDENIMFTGDTLFKESYGRTDLYGGSDSDMYESIVHKLFRYNDDIVVYPGHGDKTTIGYEKKNNDLVRGDYEF